MSSWPSSAARGAPGGNSIRRGQGYRRGRGSGRGRAGRGGTFGRDITYLGVSSDDDMPQGQQERPHQVDTPVIQQPLEEQSHTGHSALVINVEGNATIRIDLEIKEETRQGQAEDTLGGTEKSSEEDTATGSGSRGATTTATTKASSGEDLTLKEMAESMDQIQQQMQQMQQKLSAVQASVELARLPRGVFVRSQWTPPGAMQVDGVELSGNDQITTAAPEPPSNVQVPEGSGSTRYSSRLTRAPLSDDILFDGMPANQWQPPPEPESRAVSTPSTGQSTVEGQIAFAAAAVADASFLGGTLPDNARPQAAMQPSSTAPFRSLTAEEQEQVALASRKLAGTKNGMKLM
ncbi:hypothetical protein V2G26_011200 [Clonostachys chloroleuca]